MITNNNSLLEVVEDIKGEEINLFQEYFMKGLVASGVFHISEISENENKTTGKYYLKLTCTLPKNPKYSYKVFVYDRWLFDNLIEGETYLLECLINSNTSGVFIVLKKHSLLSSITI